MPKTAEEQKAINEKIRSTWRAKVAAKKAALDTSTEEEEDEAPTIEIEGAGDAPKLSFAERIKQKFSPSESGKIAKPVKRATGKKSPNVLVTVFPTVLATFVATFAQDWFKDPYKPCAPSKNECLAIFTPLLEELARSVEITSKASQTTINLMNSLLCLVLYCARAYTTYMQIKQMEKADAQASNTRSYASGHMAAMRSNQGSTPGTTRHAEHPEPALERESHANGSAATAEDGDSAGRDAEADLVSAMFKRDVEGRIRLGYLPPRV